MKHARPCEHVLVPVRAYGPSACAPPRLLHPCATRFHHHTTMALYPSPPARSDGTVAVMPADSRCVVYDSVGAAERFWIKVRPQGHKDQELERVLITAVRQAHVRGSSVPR